VGSFNGWDAGAHPLTKTPDGDWAITVYFPAGRIVYGFDIDGVFRPDPFDEDRMPNGRGSEYSIRHVRPNVESGVGRGEVVDGFADRGRSLPRAPLFHGIPYAG